MSDVDKLNIFEQVANGKLTKEQATAMLTGPQRSLYKGKPMLTLNPEDKFPFTFGLTKAKLIIDNFSAIESFFVESKDD
jgi:hypothetical protein